MLGTSSLDALQRIADRANDVLAAYAPGALPKRNDVNVAARSLPSSDPLSVVAPPGAWFVALDANGATTYTRAGAFAMAGDGTLRAPGGERILGTTAPGEPPAPLTVTAIDRALGRASDIRIENDGTLAYTRTSIEPRTRERTAERAIVGRIALARFPAGSNPQRVDATHFAGVAGVVPHLGAAGDGTFAPLETYARDRGNIDIDAGLEKLAEAYLSFSALQASHKAHGATDKVAMDLLK